MFSSDADNEPWAAGVAPIWTAAVAEEADIVLQGHVHVYEEFEKLDANGNYSAKGAKLFTVGSGGRGQVQPPLSNIASSKLVASRRVADQRRPEARPLFRFVWVPLRDGRLERPPGVLEGLQRPLRGGRAGRPWVASRWGHFPSGRLHGGPVRREAAAPPRQAASPEGCDRLGDSARARRTSRGSIRRSRGLYFALACEGGSRAPASRAGLGRAVIQATRRSRSTSAA